MQKPVDHLLHYAAKNSKKFSCTGGLVHHTYLPECNLHLFSPPYTNSNLSPHCRRTSDPDPVGRLTWLYHVLLHLLTSCWLLLNEILELSFCIYSQRKETWLGVIET